MMWPLCAVPRMLPAPRISRSRMAMRKPAPRELYCLIALIRLRAAPTAIISRGRRRYAYALCSARPTRPRAVDRLDAVMQEENLTLPLEFAIDRVANEPLIVPGHDRFHRQAIQRRSLNRGHVFYADERKVKRARDWRSGQRQDVDEFEELLKFFFVQNAEALLLVDDDEAEIFEDNIAGD